MATYAENVGKFKFEWDSHDEGWLGPDGYVYDTKTEALGYGQTGLCGCGNPERVYVFLLTCLKSNIEGNERGIDSKKITELVKADPEIVTQLILHYLDDHHMTEHGSSVYGSWVSQRGLQMIEEGPMPDPEQNKD